MIRQLVCLRLTCNSVPVSIDGIEKWLLAYGISVAPAFFSTTGDKYNNCIRLNAAYSSERVEQALETLGETARAMV